jgi:tetratricopeptide (TPR) repeat protein
VHFYSILCAKRNKLLGDLNRALELAPKDPAMSFIRGKIFKEMGDLNRAIADFTKAIKFSNNSLAPAFSCRGEAYMELREDNKALWDFCQAVKLNPYDTDAYLKRGGVSMRIGRNSAWQ